MSHARSKAEAEAVRHNAIARLASAKREKLTTQDFDVYCDGLGKYDAEIVRRVCGVLEVEEMPDYKPRFPDLPFIVSRCEAELRRRREATERKPLQLTDGDVPVDPSKWAEFRAKVHEKLEERHSMTEARRR